MQQQGNPSINQIKQEELLKSVENPQSSGEPAPLSPPGCDRAGICKELSSQLGVDSTSAFVFT